MLRKEDKILGSAMHSIAVYQQIYNELNDTRAQSDIFCLLNENKIILKSRLGVKRQDFPICMWHCY